MGVTSNTASFIYFLSFSKSYSQFFLTYRSISSSNCLLFNNDFLVSYSSSSFTFLNTSSFINLNFYDYIMRNGSTLSGFIGFPKKVFVDFDIWDVFLISTLLLAREICETCLLPSFDVFKDYDLCESRGLNFILLIGEFNSSFIKLTCSKDILLTFYKTRVEMTFLFLKFVSS